MSKKQFSLKSWSRLILLGGLFFLGAVLFQNCSSNSVTTASSESTSISFSSDELTFSSNSPAAGNAVQIYVYLSNTYDVAQTIKFKTIDSTATAGIDYLEVESSITIAANSTYGVITIPTINAGKNSNVEFQVQIGKLDSAETDQILTVTINPSSATSSSTNSYNYGTFSKVSLGFLHSCTILNYGLRCWGSNTYGQLGINSTTAYAYPVSITDFSSGVTDVSSGAYHTCAVKSGALYCWGYNSTGQIGDTTTTTRLSPVAIVFANATAVATGSTFSCAVISGAVKCWGDNSVGQLGMGSTTSYYSPVSTAYLTSSVSAVAAGNAHACAIRSGALYCWGSNAHGQVGTGSTTSYYITPQLILSSGVTSMSVGYDHTCAMQSGYLKCWGRNDYGQIGDGTSTTRLSPVLAGGGRTYSNVHAGRLHTCAILEGTVYCWGYNASGQLGISSSYTYILSETAISGLTGIIQISSGGLAHDTCVGYTGTLACWGENSSGQLGVSTLTDVNTPALLNF